MKNLIMIMIAFATFQVSAQKQIKENREKRIENNNLYSPEEIAQLQAKRMTLTLDLTDDQQAKMSDVLLKKAQHRETRKIAAKKSKTNSEKMQRSQDERFKNANENLDEQIEMKREIKKILSPEQYEQWNKMNKKRGRYNKRYVQNSRTKSEKLPQEKRQ